MEIKLVEERLYYRLNPFGVAKNLRHKKVSKKSIKNGLGLVRGNLPDLDLGKALTNTLASTYFAHKYLLAKKTR